MTLTAVILAGGGSTRMGRDKSWLQIGGQQLISRQVALLQGLNPLALFISGREAIDYSSTGCPVLRDRVPGCGPLGGIERALAVAASPLLLVVPVDLPYLTPALLKTLLGWCTDEAGVVPELDGRPEPLVAVYPKAAHAVAERHLAEGRYAAKDFAHACLSLGLATRFEVPPAEFSAFTNWNRPEDVAARSGR